MPDPWEDAAKQFKPTGQGQGTSSPNEDWRVWQQKDAPQQSMLSTIGHGIGDLALGAGRGLYSTMSAPAAFAAEQLQKHPIPGIVVDPAKLGQRKQISTPVGTMQSIGKGLEQAGEFMVPGAAEESLASLAPKAIRPLARIGTSALGAGTVNAAQGGSFATGAAMGAGGQAVGQGLKAAAPAVAEKALGIRGKFDRAYNKTPGLAALQETSGIRPETISRQAGERIGDLSTQTENMANAVSVTPTGQPRPIASLNPARGEIASAQQTAIRQNAAGTHGQLEKMGDTLSRNFHTGQPIPQDVTPRELLDLRRGFNEEHGRWNPDIHEQAVGAGRRAYGGLTGEFHRVLPESESLDTRVSNLIPVKNRAQITALGDNPLQKGLARFGAHTGALTLGGLGAAEGARERGIPGAIVGGLTGVLAPELIASPEGQMLAARTMFRSGALRPVVGLAAQATKRKDEEK